MSAVVEGGSHRDDSMLLRRVRPARCPRELHRSGLDRHRDGARPEVTVTVTEHGIKRRLTAEGAEDAEDAEKRKEFICKKRAKPRFEQRAPRSRPGSQNAGRLYTLTVPSAVGTANSPAVSVGSTASGCLSGALKLILALSFRPWLW